MICYFSVVFISSLLYICYIQDDGDNDKAKEIKADGNDVDEESTSLLHSTSDSDKNWTVTCVMPQKWQ